MGQISSPLSMRLSKSMHWSTMWLDTLNFNKKVSVDMFSNIILPLLFNETIYLNKYSNSNLISFYLNSLNINSLTVKVFYENSFFLKRANFMSLETLTPFFLSFFGKIWLLRFNKWFVLVIYVYSPKKIKSQKLSSNTSISRLQYVFWKTKSKKTFLSNNQINSMSFLF